MCTMHYSRWKDHGDANKVGTNKRPLIDRLTKRSTLNSSTGCHEWTGFRNKKGYGSIFYEGTMTSVHRAAYKEFVGAIPAGMQVLHRCDNPSCFNPSHLFLGTHLDNMADMRAKGRSKTPKRRRGEQCVHAKLTAEQVLQIRRRVEATNRVLATEFRCHPDTIKFIRSRKTWAHLEE